ncbi:hypothetical protein AGLY_009782 [Aphis glycines]|uniref:Reverse transcriptase domain-containing protein n=1 Tax=Aphis glycines TaxID=307491 RepID=A0A6G0TGW8_APHGL|nr:hypothetical protein AGLY_009782 [Aphis glycines]
MFSGTINDKSSLIGDHMSVDVAPVSLVPCDCYRPELSFNYQVKLDDSHSFQTADISATMLQESILDAIDGSFHLNPFVDHSSHHGFPLFLNLSYFSFSPSHLSISIEEVSDALKVLSNIPGVGPDDILTSLLLKCREVLCSPLCAIFNNSLMESNFPAVWKISCGIPILKSGDPTLVTNYRPVSNLPFIGKLFDLMVFKKIERCLLSTFSIDQHSFFLGRSTITSSIDFSNFIRDAFRDHSQVDAIFTDCIALPLNANRCPVHHRFKKKVSSGVPQDELLSPLI